MRLGFWVDDELPCRTEIGNFREDISDILDVHWPETVVTLVGGVVGHYIILVAHGRLEDLFLNEPRDSFHILKSHQDIRELQV